MTDLFPEARRMNIPALTFEQSQALAKIMVLNGRPLYGSDYKIQVNLLRRLIDMRLVRVLTHSPAIYGLTKLGNLARSVR